jgi:hypothetical protein
MPQAPEPSRSSAPWGNVASANITPDPSGISYYDEALFLEVMRTGQVKARKLSPIVPVMIYKNPSDDDLKAIFAFLRTVKPVKHRIDNTEPPIECKLCKQKHGAGNEQLVQSQVGSPSEESTSSAAVPAAVRRASSPADRVKRLPPQAATGRGI